MKSFDQDTIELQGPGAVKPAGVSRALPPRVFLTDTLVEASQRTSWLDLAVYALILFIGGLQFICYSHTSDFANDPQYPDLARSLLQQHSYQFDYLPEVTLPPGLAMILALVGRFFGLGPAIGFRVIALSTTLGLLLGYHLLRRVEGRGVAAVACLLLGSSPILFGFSTNLIFPEMPYFLASMLVLLLAVKIDRAKPGRFPIGSMVLLSLALIIDVLIRSVGVALLAGLVAWFGISFMVSRELGRRRLKRFLAPLVLGVAVQLGWSLWAQRHQVLEWQLPGYPESYVSQLKVKNGQYPELGLATLGDIPGRIERNLVTRAAGFTEIVTRHYVSPFWSSPAIAGVLILIALGLASSFRRGGELHDWYLLGYEAIFLLWPWDYRDRFVFPIVPLACLYLWRGVKTLRAFLIQQPGAFGVAAFAVGTILGVSSAAFALRLVPFAAESDHPRGDHLQPIAAAFFWTVIVVIGFAMLAIYSRRRVRSGALPIPWLARISGPRTSVALRAAAIALVAVLVGFGLVRQLAAARFNLRGDIKEQASYGEIQAADWIRVHEPPDRVIMARDQDMFFHYTGRRVVWFPPISDPSVLMDGIRRHHVGVVVVMSPPLRYWLPTEDVCFQALLRGYGSAFRLTHEDSSYKVYDVVPSI